MNLRPAIDAIHRYRQARTQIHNALQDQTETGLRAQHLETDRTTGHTNVTDDEGHTSPTVSDPTGNTAIRPDRARHLAAQLEATETTITTTAGQLYGTHPATIHQALQTIWIYHNHHDRPTNPQAEHTIDRAAQTLHRITVEALATNPLRPADLNHLATDGTPGCQSCARHHGWWNEPDYNGGRPTTLGGVLPEPWCICRACYRFAITTDRAPTVKELAHRKADPRGQWPKRYDHAA